MKRRFIAVLALFAVVIVPALALAGHTNIGQVLSYDRDSGALLLHTASGPSDSAVVRLRHNAQTAHLAADNPWGFPPGPCRKLAFRWNMAVRSRGSVAKFGTYLAAAAEARCSLAYTAEANVAAFGSSQAKSLVPVP